MIGSALELDVTGTGCTIDHEVSGNSIYGIQATNQEGLGTRYTLGGVSPAAIQILSNTIDLTPPGASLAGASSSASVLPSGRRTVSRYGPSPRANSRSTRRR